MRLCWSSSWCWLNFIHGLFLWILIPINFAGYAIDLINMSCGIGAGICQPDIGSEVKRRLSISIEWLLEHVIRRQSEADGLQCMCPRAPPPLPHHSLNLFYCMLRHAQAHNFKHGQTFRTSRRRREDAESCECRTSRAQLARLMLSADPHSFWSLQLFLAVSPLFPCPPSPRAQQAFWGSISY